MAIPLFYLEGLCILFVPHSFNDCYGMASVSEKFSLLQKFMSFNLSHLEENKIRHSESMNEFILYDIFN